MVNWRLIGGLEVDWRVGGWRLAGLAVGRFLRLAGWLLAVRDSRLASWRIGGGLDVVCRLLEVRGCRGLFVGVVETQERIL